jgi:Tol biopolymer transport system component
MAEVYRARDTRLGREIALKVMNEVFSRDPELIRRFEQEARLAGSLNHPNLVAVHDVGVHEGAPYLVTELLEGESLRKRLSRGRITTNTALEWASEMASGLAVAHARGVIHRDVKPDNVFVTSEGKVKLLDFGIAKLAAAAHPSGPHGLLDETLTPGGASGEVSATGALLGTPGYMSPEQVRGEPVDPRTDLFALGAVLYEMLSGRRAFEGATALESGSQVLQSDPNPLPPDVPAAVAQVVKRCLEKEPARRFQSASDFAFALDLLRGPSAALPPEEMPRGPVRNSRQLLVRAGAVALVSAVLVAGAVMLRRAPSGTRHPPLPPFEVLTLRWGSILGARFLPDGRVAFSAAFEGRPEEVFVQPLGSLIPQPLSLAETSLLAASASGELAVRVRPRLGVGWIPEGTLARVPSVGGIPRDLAEGVQFADWSPGGELAIVRRSGTRQVLEFPIGHVLFESSGWISNPRFSPSGAQIAFLDHPIRDDDMGVVMLTNLDGGTRALSTRWPTTSGLSWSPDGQEIWFAGGIERRNTLVAIGLDGTSRELYRSPIDITIDDLARDGRVLVHEGIQRGEVEYRGADGVQTLLSWTDHNGPLRALTADGRLLFTAYQPIRDAAGLSISETLFRRADGSPAQILSEGTALDLSPDERWALVGSVDKKKIEVIPTGVGRPRALDLHGLEFLSRGVRWFPDGKSVLLAGRSPDTAQFHLYQLSEGRSLKKVSNVPVGADGFLQVSPDGRFAAFLDEDAGALVLSLRDGTSRAVPRVGTELLIPEGWSGPGQLWMLLGAGSRQAQNRLLRIELESGRVLERRMITPSDPGGAGPIRDVVFSRDGRTTAYSYVRSIDTLYVSRGLGQHVSKGE